jgi:hypothetical protein
MSRTNRLWSSWIVALSLVLLGTLIAPRALSQTPSRVSPSELSANEILERASTRIAETQTMRFKLTIDGDTFVDKEHAIRLLEANGDLARPTSVHARFKVRVLGSATLTIEIITVGDQTWSTDLITGRWGQAPLEFTYNPSILFDRQEGVGPVMDRVTGAKRLDDEELDDRQVFHVQAEVDEKTIGPLTSYTMTGEPVIVDLWIDQESFDLVQARLEESKTTEDREPATWLLELYDQDEPITIEPPDTND